MGRRHFHTFDALRFISFLLVFFHHIPMEGDSWFYPLSNSGGIGVSFFFVLSGFLITYILIYEKMNKKRIDLKNFFIRRVLRIWPLFYAMILFAFLTPFIIDYIGISSSSEGYEPNWIMSLLFLENYKMMLEGMFPNVSPLGVMWSLCIEEHFYIIWGLVLYFLPVKRIPYFIVVSLVVATISRLLYYQWDLDTLDIFSNIDYFAFGAIPAYFLMKRDDIILRADKIPLLMKYFTIGITGFMILFLSNFNHDLLGFVSPLILGSLFSLVILFIITPTSYIYIADDNVMSKLGILTYGLYLFHTIIINLMLQLLKSQDLPIKNVIIAASSFLITIVVSYISYHLFEKQFLKLKRYFRS